MGLKAAECAHWGAAREKETANGRKTEQQLRARSKWGLDQCHYCKITSEGETETES